MIQRAIPEAIATHSSQLGIKTPTHKKKLLIFKIQVQFVLHPRLELAQQ